MTLQKTDLKQSIPLANLPENTLFGEGDIFVLFGELFGRGYATGLLDAAKAAGMEVIGITVGRRDDAGTLRPLTDEEHAEAEANLGGRIINVPMMAGFDMDAPEGGETPTAMLGGMTMDNWQDYKLDWDKVEECRTIGTARFTASLDEVIKQLDAMIPAGKNVFFAHTMAGGIPRAKAFLAIANRIYKGRGKRHQSSQSLIDSDLGKLILQNFDEVTANSFGHLLAQSATLRARIEGEGGQVRYTAYGYHGTRVLIDGEYRWQTYTNYTQGYAKMRLESFAQEAWNNGVKATVYNCPEIRTNSSDVFAGIELSLLPLLEALKKEGPGEWTDSVWAGCEALLKDETSLDELLGMVKAYQLSDDMAPFYNFVDWPLPNSAAQVEQTVGTSQTIVGLHSNAKELVSDLLSQHVVNATGQLIFGASSAPEGPVTWLDHDMVAKQLTK